MSEVRQFSFKTLQNEGLISSKTTRGKIKTLLNRGGSSSTCDIQTQNQPNIFMTPKTKEVREGKKPSFSISFPKLNKAVLL